MPWFSILPPSISFIETWIIRIFLFLSALAILPWLLLIIYDILLFIFRVATYELPIIGGRARNRPRPRAPSLSERPSGRPRTFSVSIPGVGSTGDIKTEDAVSSVEEFRQGLKSRSVNSTGADELRRDW